jgi:hypothetical protein
MRIAANLVERILIAAQDAVFADEHRDHRHSSNYDSMVAAFQRAGELRDRGLHLHVVRGRKSRVPKVVVSLAITRAAERGTGKYRLCLVPTGGQKTFKYWQEWCDDAGKAIKRRLTDSGIVPAVCEQWINENRLEAMPS